MSITGQVVKDLIMSQGIEVVERGSNVKRNNFNIKCPFCGQADPSHHMGIDEESGWWACWRNADHRGKSPVRLLVAITGKPVWQIRELLGLRESPDLEQFAFLRKRILEGPTMDDLFNGPGVLEFDTAFRPLKVGDLRAARFLDYVRGRGFTGLAERRVLGDYDLHYAVGGDQRDRVILPFYFGGVLVTWTGRSINGSPLRYRDLEKDASLVWKNEMLYNYDNAAMGGRALVVLEGPFDVVKGDYAGAPFGVRCVGLGTNSISDEQLALLVELGDAFEQVFVCMDTPTDFHIFDSHKMKAAIQGAVDAKVLNASSLGKDVGGAPIRAVADLFKEVARTVV